MVSAGFASEVLIARRCLAFKTFYRIQCHSRTMEKVAFFFLENMKCTAMKVFLKIHNLFACLINA